MNQAAIHVTGVTKRYGALEVLRGVDFSVPVGQLAAVIGKSGSGKSTLLGVVSGLERPDAGQVWIQGHDLSHLDERQTADLRRESIGIVFQNFSLIPSLSALDNVLLPTYCDERTSIGERRARATDLLEQVGLRDRALHRPAELSGGEQQRVAIARALVNGPSIVLADEPTGNLDTETGRSVLELLLTLSRARKTTLLIVTHDLDIASQADLVIEMKNGRIQHEPA